MKKIAPILLDFVYEEGVADERVVRQVYSRIFEKALKLMLVHKSTEEYSLINGKNNRGIFNSGRGSQKIESKDDNSLPDVSGRKNTGDQVWGAVADQQQANCGITTRKEY